MKKIKKLNIPFAKIFQYEKGMVLVHIADVELKIFPDQSNPGQYIKQQVYYLEIRHLTNVGIASQKLPFDSAMDCMTAFKAAKKEDFTDLYGAAKKEKSLLADYPLAEDCGL